jgi:NAD(P)-dependent dehydrogenase (short-subunit alcohol dehydrogenase family)
VSGGTGPSGHAPVARDPADTPSSLLGTHALVTGANRGIGLAIAHTLSAAGADVTLLVRDRAAGERAAATLPGRTEVVTACVTDEAAVQAAVRAAGHTFGPVHMGIGNAGAAESARFLATDDAAWRRMFEVNTLGAVHVARALLPDMLAARAGRLVMIASTAGLTGYPYASAYGAAKHAVVGLVRALAREVAASGVTVNAVCPGFTDTDLVAGSVARIVEATGRTPEQAAAALVANNPQRRLVTPAEVAHAVHWLCTRGAAAITGQAIAVAGGEVG